MKPTDEKQILKYDVILILISSCQPSKEALDLNVQNWIHGSENCENNIDPPIQVVKFNSNTWILRQNKCTNYEAPFHVSVFWRKQSVINGYWATQEE